MGYFKKLIQIIVGYFKKLIQIIVRQFKKLKQRIVGHLKKLIQRIVGYFKKWIQSMLLISNKYYFELCRIFSCSPSDNNTGSTTFIISIDWGCFNPKTSNHSLYRVRTLISIYSFFHLRLRVLDNESKKFVWWDNNCFVQLYGKIKAEDVSTDRA